MRVEADRFLTRFVQRLRAEVRGEVSLAVARRGLAEGQSAAMPGGATPSVKDHTGGLPDSLPYCRLAPRDAADVSAALALAAEQRMPVQFGSLPPAPASPAAFNLFARCQRTGWLLIDDGVHLKAAGAFDAGRAVIEVEPGVRVAALNRFLRPHGLWLPVEGAAGQQRSVAAAVAANEPAQTPAWGAMVDRLLGIDALLADGTAQLFGPFGTRSSINLRSGRAGQMVSALFGLAAGVETPIRQHWPPGLYQPDAYLLDCFRPLPGRPYTPDGSVNLAHLLAGSCGSLAWSARLHLRLLPRPGHQCLALFVFASVKEALPPLAALEDVQPSALQLLDAEALRALMASAAPQDRALVRDAVEALRRVGGSLDGAPGQQRAAALLVRLSGEDEQALHQRLRAMMALLGRHRASVETGVRCEEADGMSAGKMAGQDGTGGRGPEAGGPVPLWGRLLDPGQGGDSFGLAAMRAARRHGWHAPAPGSRMALALAPVAGQPARLLDWVLALEGACERVGIRLAWRGRPLSGTLALRPLPGTVEPARAWAFLEAAVGRLQAGHWHPSLQAAFAAVRHQFDPLGILAPELALGREPSGG